MGLKYFKMSENETIKTKRSLSGAYFRYNNPANNRWENWCFEDLPENNQKAIMDNKSIEWLRSMCILLANTINRVSEQFDITSESENQG